MVTIGRQKTDFLPLVLIGALVLITAAVSACLPQTMPWSFLVLAGVVLVMFWGVKWEVTLWAWFWVFSYGLLDAPAWRVDIPGFFNLTAIRFVYLAGVLAFAVHFFVRLKPLRFDSGVWWALALLAVVCAVSMSLTGWTAKTPAVLSAPYFRFLRSIILPLGMFLLVYNATTRERQIPCVLLFLTIYGWYSLYIAYLQYAAVMGLAGARALIWPSFINDPTFGIHYDRARGAFGASGPQSMYLVVLFYADLFLIRRVRGPYRWALIVQTILVPPAIFFTGLRAAYVAFGICGVLWCLWARRGRLASVKLSLAAMVVLLGAVLFWANLAQENRQTGGVAQREPIASRKILLDRSWHLFTQHPLMGVGFGHFVDAQLATQRDPISPGAFTTAVLVQHNLFLNMMAETGVIGLGVTVLVFWLTWRQSVRLFRRLPPDQGRWLGRDFVVLYWVVLVNHLTGSMFRDMLWDGFANGLLWSFAAMIAAFERLGASSDRKGLTASDGLRVGG